MNRLLAELPYDQFRIALVLHPNVWSSHSRRQIEAWLADLLVTAEEPPTAVSLAAFSPLRIRISPDRTLTVPFQVSAN